MKLLTGVFIALSLSQANAREEGWGIQFQKNAFENTVTAIGMMSETTSDVSRATLFLGCEAKEIRAFWSPGLSIENSAAIMFKSEETVVSVDFKSGDLKTVGTVRLASTESSKALIDLFSKAKTPVDFQDGSKVSKLAIVGFSETLLILQQNCK